MDELALRYGLNPHKHPARVFADRLPFRVLNGSPGYINLLDALNAWQLVRKLRSLTGLPTATSFKHVSPSGAAVASPLEASLARACFVDDLELSPLATAYARARGADRMCSFGDFVAVSDPVDASTAELLRREVSDGIIAPGFEPGVLDVLAKKKGGVYPVLEIDAGFEPGPLERRDVFGVTFEQPREAETVTGDLRVVTKNADLTDDGRRDVLVALVTLEYTQSNSVCLTLGGQAIGIGAGQQSRIHCTRLACGKAETWWLRRHPAALELPFREGIGRPDRDNAVDGFLRDDLTEPEERLWETNFERVPKRLTPAQKREWLDRLDGVVLGSDAFIPFRDNIDRAAKTGVSYVVQPGGSTRDDDVTAACDEYGIVMALTGVRLFHH